MKRYKSILKEAQDPTLKAELFTLDSQEQALSALRIIHKYGTKAEFRNMERKAYAKFPKLSLLQAGWK